MANRVSEVPDNTVSLVETQEYLKTVSIVAVFLYYTLEEYQSYMHMHYMKKKNINFCMCFINDCILYI